MTYRTFFWIWEVASVSRENPWIHFSPQKGSSRCSFCFYITFVFLIFICLPKGWFVRCSRVPSKSRRTQICLPEFHIDLQETNNWRKKKTITCILAVSNTYFSLRFHILGQRHLKLILFRVTQCSILSVSSAVVGMFYFKGLNMPALPHSKKVLIQIQAGSLEVRVCMFSLYVCGFSLSKNLHLRPTGDTKLSPRIGCEWVQLCICVALHGLVIHPGCTKSSLKHWLG